MSGARFCPNCGTAVAVEAPAPQTGSAAVDTGRERKVATMVFADLVGSTSLNESTDPEVVQVLVTRAFDRLSGEVARYGGTVEKFAGDAMLAVFGVPTVHEDDAERAVRAALEMQTAMGELAAELPAEGRAELTHADAALLARRVGMDADADAESAARLYGLAGAVPLLNDLPSLAALEAARPLARSV